MPTGGTVVWLTPALATLFMYGIAQGLVKKYVGDISPARFCLFFIVARTLLFLAYFFYKGDALPFDPEARSLLYVAILAYVFDGLGWIFYYKSIPLGPITIVGTLSAAYPAPTIVFAAMFLEGETLSILQYVGVAMVLGGCIGLSIDPTAEKTEAKSRVWILYAGLALIIWGVAQTLLKYAYTLPRATDATILFCGVFGGAATLGVYGLLFGRGSSGGSQAKEWARAFFPMLLMAGGDLGYVVALEKGPVSIVTPLTAAYPAVTIVFAAFLLKEKITVTQYLGIAVVLGGMYLCIS